MNTWVETAKALIEAQTLMPGMNLKPRRGETPGKLPPEPKPTISELVTPKIRFNIIMAVQGMVSNMEVPPNPGVWARRIVESPYDIYPRVRDKLIRHFLDEEESQMWDDYDVDVISRWLKTLAKLLGGSKTLLKTWKGRTFSKKSAPKSGLDRKTVLKRFETYYDENQSAADNVAHRGGYYAERALEEFDADENWIYDTAHIDWDAYDHDDLYEHWMRIAVEIARREHNLPDSSVYVRKYGRR